MEPKFETYPIDADENFLRQALLREVRNYELKRRAKRGSSAAFAAADGPERRADRVVDMAIMKGLQVSIFEISPHCVVVPASAGLRKGSSGAWA